MSIHWELSYIFFSGQIYFKKKKTGGISFNSTLPLTHVDEKLCYQILHEYKIHNAEVCISYLVSIKCQECPSSRLIMNLSGHTQLVYIISNPPQIVVVDRSILYFYLSPWPSHEEECLLFYSLQLLFREDATVDDLIDVIEGNRKYMKCVYVYNKIDVIGIDDVDKLARQPNSIVISCNLKASY